MQIEMSHELFSSDNCVAHFQHYVDMGCDNFNINRSFVCPRFFPNEKTMKEKVTIQENNNAY